ncbi:hypothetical protein NSQ91_14240 [Paenibacillus sp. FSL R7-0048]|uniref:hypothetical protein n=1 Tax=Paenibacillus TaxID=44249 RepID=UPI00096FFDF7|nr:hypothetical protein [Paenibacillus odorifer]OMD87841.1 hypothetical protein BSK53_02310 [Paenibacillus odorifer]
MNKGLKKIIVSTMAISLSLSIPIAANAATEPVESEAQAVNENVIFTVDVNSETELNQFLTELDAHNKKSQALWENALVRSQNPSVEREEVANISPRSVEISSVSKYVKFSGHSGNLGAYVSYNRETRGSSYIFGDINGFYMYGSSSTTTVSNLNYDGVKIDASRTYAVTSTLLVGVKDYHDNFSYYPYQAYIEFNTSGSGTWY